MRRFTIQISKYLLLWVILIAGVQVYAQTPDANGIVYVKATATGNQSGDSWANATANLQGAIDATGTQKVFVAQGSYHIPPFPLDKSYLSGFVMKNNVEIYGGFLPVNNTTDWSTRILPNRGMGDGSVLEALWEDRATVLKFNNSDASAVLDGFTITAGMGGGIINSNASPTLRNLIITGNGARSGGGINNYNSSPVITDVVLYNNIAYTDIGANTGLGGAVYNSGNSSPILINVLVVGNSIDRSGGGGGIYHSGTGTMQLINATIDNNLAGLNGGAPNAITINSGSVSISNSIVYGGITGTYSAQYSMIQGNTDFSNGNIDALGFTSGDIFVSPISGLTSSLGNYRLTYTAPAINAGNNLLFTGLDANSKDIAGNNRVKDYNNTGLVIDMGAYESAYTAILPTNGIVYVKPSATGNADGSSWEDATNDLHKAIQTPSVTKVFVAIGNYPVGEQSFIMKNGVEIYGGFDPDNNIRTLSDTRIYPSLTTEGSTLDGQNTRPVIWNVYTATQPLDNTSILDGFTVKNGSYGGSGAGIRNIYASPVFNHLVIKNNSVNNSNFGGGIYNSHASPTFLNTLVSNNSAYIGGGVYSEYSTPKFINYLSFGNTANANLTNKNNEFCVTVQSTATLINATIIGVNSTDISLSANDIVINSIIPNGINSSNYAPALSLMKNSLIKGVVSGGTNGNIDASGMSLTDIFTDPEHSDFSLKSNALAVNTGNNSLFPDLDATTLDLLGNNRVYDFSNGGIIDMGAFESTSNHAYLPYSADANGIIYVRPVPFGNGTGSSWENATDKFQAAINTFNVQKVFVASGTYLFNTTNHYMKNAVAIYGGFDPDHGIRTLADQRILPDGISTTIGSVITGSSGNAVFYNWFSAGNVLNNTAVLDGFTIKNGNSVNGAGQGGGMYNFYASPTLRNLFITQNKAGKGGGIFNNYYSSPIIADVVIAGNTANFGAGIYNDVSSSPSLTNVVFKENIAANDGGGINNNNSSPLMSGVKFQNNQANYGGGVFNRNASPTMTNIEITNNIANKDAGGMYNDANSSPTIINMVLTGNTANNANGGGMYNRSNSSPVITNALIANNTAVNNGGAIRNETTSSPVLTNVTIADNNGSNSVYATDGTTTFANSIFYGSVTRTYTAQYSLIEGNTDFSNGNLDASSVATGAIFTNPTANNYTLLNSSLAVNAGNNTLFAGLDVNTKDLAGSPRAYNAGIIDLGAYEYQGDPAVLPVKLIVFTAKTDGNHTKLQWQTANETNNKGFEIWRSGVDGNFVKIDGVPASHVSNFTSQIYSYTDYSPLNGINYYKLVQVDNDGKATDLGIRTVTYNFQFSTFNLYPNPTTDVLTSSFAADIYHQLEIMDLNGKVLQNKVINPTENEKTLSLGTYPAGTYLIKLTGKNKITVEKVIKK